MIQLQLKDLVKVYPYARVSGLFGRKKARAMLEEQKRKPYTTNEGVLAIRKISLDIEEGAFLVLLGASGCGKTTLLRMIAGLEEVSAGEIWMDGNRIDSLPPEDRDMAMIFQNYSLYPHFTVYENIAFPLKNLHMPREELHATVMEIVHALGLEKLLDRRPGELSGGQRQRVAIGRALVRRPRLFLMDEPFSNLDAPMRQSLRLLVKRLHQKLGTTFIYVTHDQMEAFSLGTRIAVMRDGIIEQTGTPQELYNDPANRFVASFLGQPSMNFVENVPVFFDGAWQAEIFGVRYLLTGQQVEKLNDLPSGSKTAVGIRPVNITLHAGPHRGTVEYAEPIGTETMVHLNVSGETLVAVIPGDGGSLPVRGTEVSFGLDPGRFYLFP